MNNTDCGCVVKMESRDTGRMEGGGHVTELVPVITYCALHGSAAALVAGAEDLFEKLPEAAMLGAKLRLALAKAKEDL